MSVIVLAWAIFTLVYRSFLFADNGRTVREVAHDVSNLRSDGGLAGKVVLIAYNRSVNLAFRAMLLLILLVLTFAGIAGKRLATKAHARRPAPRPAVCRSAGSEYFSAGINGLGVVASSF